MKNLLITLSLFLTTSCITAQIPSIEWQKSLGGSGYDFGYYTQQTSDGGYIAIGQSGSTDGDVTGNHGGDDYWAVKLTNTGAITWQKALGGSGNDIGLCIQQTTDGGYIAVGESYSNDGDVTGNHGSSDFWVIKLSNSGNIEWQKTLGGSGRDVGRFIKQTTDGGYIVVGFTYSTDGDVTGNNGGEDYWVVKLSSTGSITWQKALGGTGTDQAYSVQQTTDGGFIIAGNSGSTDGDVTGNHGDRDYWIVKLSITGSIVWQKSLGGTGYDWGQSIQQTTDGGYVVVGYSSSNDGDVTSNQGGWDYWVVKLSSTGTIEWQKALGGTGNEFGWNIQQTTDGNYIVSGRSNSTNGDVTGNHGDYDYWIVKLSNTGSIIWQKSLGGSGNDWGWSIQQTTDGGYIILGYSYSTNGDITGNHGYSDYWIVKLSPIVGVNEIIQLNEFSVYPNPTRSQVNLKVNTKLIGTFYSIYDNMGKTVMSGIINAENTVVELDKLSGGIYLFSVGKNSQQTFKVIKN